MCRLRPHTNSKNPSPNQDVSPAFWVPGSLMTVKCDPLRRHFDNKFEEEVFNCLCESLEREAGEYRVLGPFRVPKSGKNIEIDCLVISPYCVFTIEAKDFKGKVEKKANTETRISIDGVWHDFQDRQQDPYDQADKQWRMLSAYCRNDCAIEGIWYKGVLVFREGSTFDVPGETRKIDSDDPVPYFCALQELPSFIKDFRPPRYVPLTGQIQDALVTAIKYGVDDLTYQEKQVLAAASGIQRGSRPQTAHLGSWPPGARTSSPPPPAPGAKPPTLVYEPLPGVESPARAATHPPKRAKGKSWGRSCLARLFLALIVLAVGIGSLSLLGLVSLPFGGVQEFVTTIKERLSGTWEASGVKDQVVESVATFIPKASEWVAVGTPRPTKTAKPGGTVTATLSSEPASGLQLRACVNVSSLNIRNGPAVDYQAIGYLYKGDCVALIGRNRTGSWVEIDRGWISAGFLEVEGDVMLLPVGKTPVK